MQKIDISVPPNWQIGSKKIITQDQWDELDIKEKTFLKLRENRETDENLIVKTLNISRHDFSSLKRGIMKKFFNPLS